ncbi:unnamed protein product [Rhodiola kirilowii]
MDEMATHNKMLETQLAQHASSSSRQQGKLPSKLDLYPIEHINAITLKSGRMLESPTLKARATTSHGSTNIEDDKEENEEEIPTPSNEFLKEMTKEATKELPPYKPPMPFPQRQKHEISEVSSVDLSAECSAIVQNHMPKKLGDPGSFSIPITIGEIMIKNALCDLGASISLMPYSLCKKLDMGTLNPTSICLRLADRSSRVPKGVLEDVLVKVGKFYIPVDFFVLEMEEDQEIPIILGRPFLKTTSAVINCGIDSLEFEVEKKLNFT